MRIYPRHSWNVTPTEAVALQRRLKPELITTTPLDLKRIRLVAGVDVSVKNNVSNAAVVVVSLPDFRIVEKATAEQPTPFPYVPGLLSFREGPVLEEAFSRLESEPDVFIFDGMGIAHPRRMGIAAHMGLWLERPTIGCGKTRLCGSHGDVMETRGSFAPLMDRGENIGVALRTRARVAPVYISPGHRTDLGSAIGLILACTPRWRLPEPIRLAHKTAGEFTPETRLFGT
ncbi:endonuclease V [Agaricicola taiwanensis]|uniref:Endonuclease V n=1 Tax=Agaricicola taiwanensis TaxID=591372 RepID=A0A8J2VUA1_9RHOB|nr:deoxyribonuclease V [Agaricicola taiwanensis]GGE40081.1 endonuclease V [Agaricicola taiwanensis]